MTDDIVTRLREIPAVIQTLGAEWVNELDAARLALEAADEIEQLRRWKELAYDIRNGWFGIPRKYEMKFKELHNADWEKVRGG